MKTKRSRKQQIGFLGGGKMASAIVRGLQHSALAKRYQFCATTSSAKSAQKLSKTLKIPVHNDNARLIRESDILVLAVKPQQIKEVLKPFTLLFDQNKVIISLCAGITISSLKKLLHKKSPIARCMPNTPLSIKEGVSALSFSKAFPRKSKQAVLALFSELGLTIEISESKFDAFTALCGCGPAFVFEIAHHLEQTAKSMGLPSSLVSPLVAQMLYGSSALIKYSNKSPQTLCQEVCSPKGATIEGIRVLRSRQIAQILQTTLQASRKRAHALGKLL